MRLFLIRHGVTPWTDARRYQGTGDLPLSSEGIRQAKTVARLFQREKLSTIYTSTLSRASHSGEIIGDSLGLKPLSDARLNEIDFGDWEGAHYPSLSRRKAPLFQKWRNGELAKPPGGESLRSLAQRVEQFLREIVKRHKKDTIAVVSHASPIKIILMKILNFNGGGGTRRAVPLPSIWSFRIDPASVSLVEGNEDLFQIIYVNQTHHLPQR